MNEPVFKKPPPDGDHQPPPKPKRFWLKFTLGALIIVWSLPPRPRSASSASSTASPMRYLTTTSTRTSSSALAKVNGGAPENILILGSDQRANLKEDPGRSDTTMLLRLDPDRNAIAVMSIPRDLEDGNTRLRDREVQRSVYVRWPEADPAAVKDLTGLQINHVVNVDFLGFVRAVDAIDCVYIDVDRRYYHSNAESSEEYSEINIKPGYQLLCGKKALQYVRYRHTDTDLVRAARQQDFISAARQRVPTTSCGLGGNELIDIFTHYTTSDISDTETMIDILKLFIASREAEINEVHFPAELGPSYVYSTPAAIEGAVEEFLGIEASPGPRGQIERPGATEEEGQERKEGQEE